MYLVLSMIEQVENVPFSIYFIATMLQVAGTWNLSLPATVRRGDF
jgi:hypothetical protein